MTNTNISNHLHRMAQRRGCTIRRTGNLIQVVKQGIGTVFQDHRLSEVECYIGSAPMFMAYNADFGSHFYTDERPCALKYGRITTRP